MKIALTAHPDPLIKRMLFLSLFLDILLVVGIGVAYRYLPPEVPLLYSAPWGKAQIVPRSFLFLVPAAAVLFLAGTVLAERALTDKDMLVLKVLWGGCAFVTFLGAITVMRVIFLFLW
ncbi:hypothetical protein HYV21_02510 [Candidatus Microgenomates bacterium]|nr:hypothetical protein [Candidatus Microgenomates bacterium]